MGELIAVGDTVEYRRTDSEERVIGIVKEIVNSVYGTMYKVKPKSGKCEYIGFKENDVRIIEKFHNIKSLDLYQDDNKHIVIVVAIGIDTATNEKKVVYKSVNNKDNKVFISNIDAFTINFKEIQNDGGKISTDV